LDWTIDLTTLLIMNKEIVIN